MQVVPFHVRENKRNINQICVYMAWPYRPGVFNKKDNYLEMIQGPPFFAFDSEVCLSKMNRIL